MAARGSDGDGLVIIPEQADVRGGSERVLDAILDRFPAAQLVAPTFAAERDEGPALAWTARARLVRFKGRRRHFLAPVYARRVAAVPLEGARVVLTMAHGGWCLAADVPPGARHLCYSAGLPRQLYGQTETYLKDYPRVVRPLLRSAVPLLRAYDRRLIGKPDRIVVNSAASAKALALQHGIVSEVVHPPVATTFFTPSERRRGHVLVVARTVLHKRVDLVLEAFRNLDENLVVVGTGPWLERFQAAAPPNARFTGFVPDEELRELYRGAFALIHPGVEEFGIAMAEAQACGTPVIAPRAGGAVEIVRDGETGILLDRVEGPTIAAAVQEVRRLGFSPDACRRAATPFSEARFVEQLGSIVEEELALAASATRRAAFPRTGEPDLMQAPLAPR